jgi:hypothetical protein
MYQVDLGKSDMLRLAPLWVGRSYAWGQRSEIRGNIFWRNMDLWAKGLRHMHFRCLMITVKSISTLYTINMVLMISRIDYFL